MADNPPISTEAPETVTVDLGVDKEQLGNLTEAFDDFWKGEDEKAEAPAAPGPAEGPGQETKETKALEQEKPQPEAREEEAKPKTEAAPAETKPRAQITDEEIDGLELPPSARTRSEVGEQFRRVKEMWKADRAEARGLKQQLDTLASQLAEARQNALTPEARADYENAAWYRRQADLSSDPGFIQRFHMPVLAKYHEILDEAVGMLPDRDAALKWAQDMKQNWQPDQLNKDWWTRSVVDQVPSELDKSTLRDYISQLFRLRKERDSELARHTQDQPAFEQFKAAREQQNADWVTNRIKAAIGRLEQQSYIKELLPRDPEKAKTADERKAIEAHNERFTKINSRFTDFVKEASADPGGWVNVAAEATRAMVLAEEVERLNKELGDVKTERDQFRSELDKITGVRRKIAHTTGTPPASADKRNGQGLSVKDLGDVRKAFDNFDWGDRS